MKPFITAALLISFILILPGCGQHTESAERELAQRIQHADLADESEVIQLQLSTTTGTPANLRSNLEQLNNVLVEINGLKKVWSVHMTRAHDHVRSASNFLQSADSSASDSELSKLAPEKRELDEIDAKLILLEARFSNLTNSIHEIARTLAR